MKVLYVDNLKGKGCNYYFDMVKSLRQHCELEQCSPHEIVSKLSKVTPDVILIGFGITDCGEICPSLKLGKLIGNIPVYIIINKEYAGLRPKLEWVKSINPVKVFTVHHDTDKYELICGIPFVRIMWSADSSVFRHYDEVYKYDVFFSGVIRPEQTNNLRNKIYNKMPLLNKYNNLINARFFNTKSPALNNHKHFSNVDYAKKINHSKIVLTTTGPADLVGTRYFEIMASNKALVLCNRMPKSIYGDIVVDGYNCVMFDDENDFVEKCDYYLTHETERLRIVRKAYEHFTKHCTWSHTAKHVLSNIVDTSSCN